MKGQCLACGIEKDTDAKEVYPYPEDGLIDEPIEALFTLDCQGSNDWRKATVCHECFHSLDPDQWINAAAWELLNPITPFDRLPNSV